MPEDARIFKAVNATVFRELLVEAGDGSEEDDGRYIIEIGTAGELSDNIG